MRRQNELALRNEVLKTLAEWRGVLRDAALIFVAASKTDASTIFDEKSGSPIRADDPRVRRVPFATKRPTFAETRRVVARLAGVNPRVRAVDDGSEKDKSPGETTLEPFQTQKGKKKDVSGKEEAACDTDASEAARAEGNGLTPAQAARLDAIAARARAPRARWRPRRTRRPRSPRSRTWRSRIIARRGPRRVAPSLTRRRRRRRRRRSGGRRSGKRRRRRRNARGARPRSEEVVEEKWRTRARRTRVLAGRDRGRPREARPPRSSRARGKRTRGRRATPRCVPRGRRFGDPLFFSATLLFLLLLLLLLALKVFFLSADSRFPRFPPVSFRRLAPSSQALAAARRDACLRAAHARAGGPSGVPGVLAGAFAGGGGSIAGGPGSGGSASKAAESDDGSRMDRRGV